MNTKREAKKRIPAGMPRQKLKVEGLDENKRGYWATEEQFQELQDAGYTFVVNNADIKVGEDGKVDKGSLISRPASRSNDKKLYLMEIDKGFYEENQHIKQERIKQSEQQMFQREDTETSYVVGDNKLSSELVGA